MDVTIISLEPKDRRVGGILNADEDQATPEGTVPRLSTVGNKVIARGRGGDGMGLAYQKGETPFDEVEQHIQRTYQSVFQSRNQ